MIEYLEITDIETLMCWRAEVITNVFSQIPTPELLAANRHYYERAVPSGKHFAILAKFEGNDSGCGGICLSEELPSPDNPSGRCAYIMNIYVRKPYRLHGIAHSIVRQLIDKARELGCGKIYLETTAEGRPIYESIGFHDMPDMMKYYDT